MLKPWIIDLWSRTLDELLYSVLVFVSLSEHYSKLSAWIMQLTFVAAGAEKPPVSPSHRHSRPSNGDSKEILGSPRTPWNSLTEEQKLATLHNLNDKLLKQVASLQTHRESLTNKVLQIEEELNVVSNLLAYYFRAFWSFVESFTVICEQVLRSLYHSHFDGYESQVMQTSDGYM